MKITRLILIAMVVLTSSSIALVQDFCKGLAACDQDVDTDDVEEFLKHCGRHQFNNPCPPDGPALPTGHPFTNVPPYVHWSSTTASFTDGDETWYVSTGKGYVGSNGKRNDYDVWCVRGGH